MQRLARLKRQGNPPDQFAGESRDNENSAWHPPIMPHPRNRTPSGPTDRFLRTTVVLNSPALERGRTMSWRAMLNPRPAVLALLCASSLAPVVAAAATCSGHGVQVQVLGSGGPELEDKRASSSYLVWQDGRPRILIDSGGGSALRFGQSGAHLAQLDAVLFTHLHIDHSADFPALINSSYFEERKLPLPVYGPPGNENFPSTTEFVADLFDGKRGAYRYLADFLAGKDGGYSPQAHDVVLTTREIRTVVRPRDLLLDATQVIHGGVPAIAWRFSIGRRIIVFSGE